MLSKKGFGASTLRPINGRAEQAFQGLFIARNNIDLLSAVCKISGNAIELEPVEKRMAFREAVAYYRSTNTDPKRPLPNLLVMDEYSRQRMFLPNTGVICPSGTAFKYTQKPLNVSSLFVQYARFFSIPDEISIEDLRTIMPRPIEDIREVHEKLRAYREVMQSTLGISLPNLDVNRPGSDEEIMQIATKTCVMFKTIDLQDEALMGMLLEFAKRYGKIDVEIPPELRPEPLSVSLRIPKRGRVASPEDTLQAFKDVWEFANPLGFKLDEKVLVDPPTVAYFKNARSIQNQIIKTHGGLSEELCDEVDVPSFIVPTTQEITKYKGKCGGRGLLAILRDIEDSVWPIDSRDQIEADEEIGIIFTPEKRSQLITLQSIYNKLEEQNPDHAPRAITSHYMSVTKKVIEQQPDASRAEMLKEREIARREKMQRQILLDQQNEEQRQAAKERREAADKLRQEREEREKAANDLQDEETAIPVSEQVDVATQLKRRRNLEELIVNEWFKKIAANEKYTISDFINYLIKNYDKSLILDGVEPTKRLFQGLDDEGNQLSFLEGLEARIAVKMLTRTEKDPLVVERPPVHFVVPVTDRKT